MLTRVGSPKKKLPSSIKKQVIKKVIKIIDIPRKPVLFFILSAYLL
jgi:hypothetical protein